MMSTTIKKTSKLLDDYSTLLDSINEQLVVSDERCAELEADLLSAKEMIRSLELEAEILRRANDYLVKQLKEAEEELESYGW